jgi:integrase
MAGLMPAETAAAINDVKGAPRRGKRIGNWLTREQAQELLSLPDRESLKGKRDYAILALLLGCGLRSVAVPAWVKAAIDAWTTAAGPLPKGRSFARAQGGQNLGPGSHARCGTAERSALREGDGSRKVGAP